MRAAASTSGVEAATGRRHDHHQPPAPRRPSPAARSSAPTTDRPRSRRDVEADGIDRRPAPAQPHAVGVDHVEIGRPSGARGRRGCALRRAREPRASLARTRPRRAVDLRLADPQPASSTPDVVEAARIVQHRLIATLTDIVEDRRDRRLDVLLPPRDGAASSAAKAPSKSGSRTSSRVGMHHLAETIEPMRRFAVGRVFQAVRLTASREVMSAICSISTRPFAFRVAPLETRSTMRWLSPSTGASSIAPLSTMHSACTPRPAKWRAVRRGYLVATRI